MDQLSDYQKQVVAAQRQFDYEENRSPHALFRKAKAALYIRLYKLRSVAERLPLIVEKGVGTVQQLQDIIWYIAVATKDARAECPRDIRGNLCFGGSAVGIPDGLESLDLYVIRYYDCEPPVYNAKSARASVEHGARTVVHPGGPGYPYKMKDGKVDFS
jgi:hypothetical protein